MLSEEFAANRRAIFRRADDELIRSVREALGLYMAGDPDWRKELIADASVIWLEVFSSEAPNADSERYMPRFQESIGESLAQTERPEGEVTEAQVERVTRWLGTFTVNHATWAGSGARGTRGKRWVTMHDRSVRETHVVADGQVRPVAAPFNVGGFELRFPGDPVGPPEVWINCRCIIQPAERRGTANVSPTTFALEDDADLEVEAVEEDDDFPADELDDDEEEVTEIPVHGVLAPEGVPTGDGRQFAINSLSHRDLPLPLQYQIMSDEGHKSAVTVGRIDEIFRDGNLYKFRGALIVTREKTSEVIEGIIDGTVRGVSVDVDNFVIGEMVEDETRQFVEFAEARVSGATIVAIPAFQEAFLALGWEFPEELDTESLAACASCAEEADAEVEEFRDYSAEERRRLAKEGKALPDGSFPIVDEEDLRNAIQAIGRAKDPAAARAHIKKRARALGHADLIPEGWAAQVVDLTGLTEAELEEYNAMSPEEQDEWLEESHPEAIVAAAFAPGTKDGPGWITHPIPTARIRRYWVRGKGALKIRWGQPGDFNRCRRQLVKYIKNPAWLAGACANMHKEAIGIWPATHGRGKHAIALTASALTPAPIFTITAASTRVFDADLFKRKELDNPRVGVVVDGDQVYGYIAQWGVCHIGIDGVCTEAPPSMTDYWYYQTGVVDTTEGPVSVGQITMDTGHAPLNASAKIAAAHYDNTGAAVADVHVGEDDFGIWFSGVLRPGVTDEQRHALRASGRVSGDWRAIGGNLELVAGLVVNVPGFPIPAPMVASAEGVQTALVAAGVIPPDPAVTASASPNLDAEQIAGIVRTAVAEYRHAEKKAAKVEPLRATLRQKRIESLRAKIKE